MTNDLPLKRQTEFAALSLLLCFWRRPKPGGFLVAESVGGQHCEILLGGAVEVQATIAFGGDGAKVPAGGMHPHHLARALKRSRLAQVAFAIGSPAQAQEPAIGRPV